jgi:transcription elongation factor GreA
MAEEKMILTQDGIDKLKAEYRHLIDIDRPDVIEALKAARAQGDLSENADYDAARDRQAKIESRITEIEHIMDIAVIVDESKVGKRSS